MLDRADEMKTPPGSHVLIALAKCAPNNGLSAQRIKEVETELRLLDICRCHHCRTFEHIDLLDGKPSDGDENGDFDSLLCIACYGPGWRPTSGEQDTAKSVEPRFAPYYAKWADQARAAARLVTHRSTIAETVVGARVTRAMKATLERMATDVDLTLSSYVSRVLRDHVSQRALRMARDPLLRQ
jgi:hypothetical protein